MSGEQFYVCLCVLHRSEACDHFVNLAKRYLPLPNLHLRGICVQKKKLFAVRQVSGETYPFVWFHADYAKKQIIKELK